jgi:hypothetical protein
MLMKPMMTGVALIAILVPAIASAGQIYGTIVLDGKGLKDQAVEIKCGSNDAVAAKTAADGGYRLNVPQQGQCTLTLTGYEGKPSAMVFSTSNPSAYNFEIVKGADGKFELKRRS